MSYEQLCEDHAERGFEHFPKNLTSGYAELGEQYDGKYSLHVSAHPGSQLFAFFGGISKQRFWKPWSDNIHQSTMEVESDFT